LKGKGPKNRTFSATIKHKGNQTNKSKISPKSKTEKNIKITTPPNNNNKQSVKHSINSSINISNINPLNSTSNFKSTNFNPIIEEQEEDNNTVGKSITNKSNLINSTNSIKNETQSQVLKNSLKSSTQSLNPNSISINKNANFFLKSTNTFKDTKPKIINQPNINVMKSSEDKPNPLTQSKMMTVSLDDPDYFKKKPLEPNTFRGTTSISLVNPKNSEILSKSHVINNIDQTINHVPMKAEEMKVNTQNYIEDERYSAFNVEFPVKYYYELSKEYEPPKTKEWFLRPHHTETFVEPKNAIPDDIMNTKYISYYAPPEQEKKKSRQEIIEELIMETRSHINDLKEDMFKKSNLNPAGEKLYNKLEGLKEEAKSNFIPGYREAKEAKKKNIFEMLKDPNSGASYTEMFDQNDDIKQTNFTISTLGTMLSELRDKERDLINIKRKQEYERIRPPVDKWYELKGDSFLKEIIRNKMVLNSGPEYFQKIEELQDEDLY
jgi:hypothetical protein